MTTTNSDLYLARQRWHAGDIPGSIELYKAQLASDPNCHESLLALAVTTQQSGDLSEAVEFYRRALVVQPDADVHFRVGLLLVTLNRPVEAIVQFREAARLRPDAPETWLNLGNLLLADQYVVEAIQCYRTAVRLRPDFAEAYQNLGNALRENDNLPEGILWYREAVRLRPNYVKAHNNLAAALLETGDTTEAEEHFRICLRLAPNSANVLAALAVNGMYGPTDPSVTDLRSRLADPHTTESEASQLHFVLAQQLDRADQPDAAFQHYLSSNHLRRELARRGGNAFDRASHARFIDQLIATFTPEYFQRVQGWGSPSDVPIFVIGMPRSGSTLVEQILSHHPAIGGVGELRLLPQLIDGLPQRLNTKTSYPDCLSRLDVGHVKAMAEIYLQCVEALSGAKTRVIDKMLLNFQHVGLLATLFSRGRVIHCRRNPLDTCVSCFFQIFRGLEFTLDLADLGHYYVDYQRLMAHWRAVSPLPMLEVVYEDLVRDTEAASRRLVEFCGLPWDERCLRYYENPRAVRTMSKLQVRQPIYNSSIGRWRRYAAHLEPLCDALSLTGLNSDAAGG